MQIKKDIEIAQEAVLEPIVTIAERLGMQEDDLELYGRYKAKLSEEYMHRIEDRPDGRLILVTAINPTPAGEGKTTTSVGLSQAFGKLGKNALLTLREPSLGPCFGIKGGAAGGGGGGHILWPLHPPLDFKIGYPGSRQLLHPGEEGEVL